MPRYTIQTPSGRKVTIEADNEGAAMAGAQQYHDDELATVQTVYGEARGDPDSQAGVAATILNRANLSGKGPRDIVTAKGQYEPWSDQQARMRMESLDPSSPEYQDILQRISPVLRGEDPTDGATHFYAPKAQAQLGRKPPSWDDGTGVDVGAHRFFKRAGDFGDAPAMPGAHRAEQPGPGLEVDATLPADPQRLAEVDAAIAAKDALRSGAKPNPKTAALLAGARPAQKPSIVSEVLNDAASGAASPWKALTRDIGASYAASKQRLSENPFAKSPIEVGKESLRDFADTAGVLGDVAALPGMVSQTFVRPISRQLAKLPVPMYDTPGLLDYNKGFPRELKTREERAAAFEHDINTALMGARPANAKGPQPPKFKSVDELKAAKTAAYDAVDKMGITYEPSAVQNLSARAAKVVADEGGAALYPKSAAMAGRIEKVLNSPDVTLGKLDKLRAQIGEVVIKDEPVMGYRLRDMVDEFIDAADPATIASGNGTEAAAAIRNARELNMRFKKAEAVTAAMESADLRASSTYAGGNQENAIRQNIRPLIDPKSKQRIRNFTPAEARAANKVVRGSPAQNAVRLTGKMLDPRGWLGAAIQTGMGLPSHGLTLATAPLGVAATEAGKMFTQGNVKGLLNLIAAGGKPPLPVGPGAIPNVRLLSPTGAVGAAVLDAPVARLPGPAEMARARAKARADEEKKRKAR